MSYSIEGASFDTADYYKLPQQFGFANLIVFFVFFSPHPFYPTASFIIAIIKNMHMYFDAMKAGYILQQSKHLETGWNIRKAY